MWDVLKIVILIVAPLLWGLAVEWVFERIRRHRAKAGSDAADGGEAQA